MDHPQDVLKYAGTLQDLARDIANLRYDKIVEFLGYLATEINQQAVGDKEKGREQLASALEIAAKLLDKAAHKFEGIWRICEPYIKEKE